jgi:FkbM family methyltransferase
MNRKKIKMMLVRLLGERVAANIHGLRFVFRIKQNPLADPEVQLLPRFAKNGDVAVDVGANGANWTYALHKVVGPKGRVLAFEADPYYAKATASAIRFMRLKGVTAFPFGLSDKEEDVPLRVTDDEGLRFDGLAYVDRERKSDSRKVTMITLRTLDSIIPQYPELVRTAILKCDVEGYELFVLRGASEILSKARPVVILETGHFERQGYSSRDVSGFFSQRYYGAFALLSNGRLARTDATLVHPEATNPNRIFIPHEKAEAFQDLLGDSHGALFYSSLPKTPDN